MGFQCNAFSFCPGYDKDPEPTGFRTYVFSEESNTQHKSDCYTYKFYEKAYADMRAQSPQTLKEAREASQERDYFKLKSEDMSQRLRDAQAELEASKRKSSEGLMHQPEVEV